MVETNKLWLVKLHLKLSSDLLPPSRGNELSNALLTPAWSLALSERGRNGKGLFWDIISMYLHRKTHDDVIKWKHFPRYWPFVREIRRSPVNSPHKDQWCGALRFSLICTWVNYWINNREAGDLRRHRAHYDVIVMWWSAVLKLVFDMLLISLLICWLTNIFFITRKQHICVNKQNKNKTKRNKTKTLYRQRQQDKQQQERW